MSSHRNACDRALIPLICPVGWSGSGSHSGLMFARCSAFVSLRISVWVFAVKPSVVSPAMCQP